MQTTSTSTTLVTFDPNFADPERVALAGFLAGYSGQTRDAYGLDLRQFLAFCHERGLELLKVRPGRHRDLRSHPGGTRPGPGHHRPPPVNCGRVLSLRRGRRPH